MQSLQVFVLFYFYFLFLLAVFSVGKLETVQPVVRRGSAGVAYNKFDL